MHHVVEKNKEFFQGRLKIWGLQRGQPLTFDKGNFGGFGDRVTEKYTSSIRQPTVKGAHKTLPEFRVL